jgi:hypothetical protein
MAYADGGVYTGAWVRNKREGQGVMKFGASQIGEGDYEGEWSNDLR